MLEAAIAVAELETLRQRAAGETGPGQDGVHQQPELRS